MNEFISATALLLALLNPFLVIVYLVDAVEKLDVKRFLRVLLIAGLITGAVFCCFALLGDAIFARLMHVDFASFQIFGGIVLLLIGVQFVFRGPTAIEILRGESENLAGAIAMPVLIGPGTISASVIVGKRLAPLYACGSILIAVATSILFMFLLKVGHDFIRPKRARIVQRYIEIAGRVTALYAGTVAIDMIMQGIKTWVSKF